MKFEKLHRVFVILILVVKTLGASTMVVAQTAELPRRTVPFSWSSGSFDGNHPLKSEGLTQPAPARSDIISIADVSWMQLHFQHVQLGSQSRIEITSLLDGATQVLDTATSRQWNHRSAYFNGDAVEVRLFVGPQDRGISIEISEILVGKWSPGLNKSICGSRDDRFASTNPRVGRIDPVGCTGWISDNGRLITAGHCLAVPGNNTLSFNVPLSLSNEMVQFPGPEDQYVIDQGSFQFVDDGIGNDWGIFAVFNNSSTGLQPIQAQGSFSVRQDLGPSNIRVTGFGEDNGTGNRTNQTHIGPNAGSSGTTMRYQTDALEGNSGSPLIDEATGVTVGILTHSGCASRGYNHGTSFFNSALWSALNAGCSGETSLFTHRGDVLGDGVGIHAYPALTGDVDGDSLTDLIFVGQNWSGPGLNIRTKFSNGDGTWTHREDVLGDGVGVHAYPAFTGDVDGDGRTDLIFVGQNWSGPGLNIRTKFSNGDGTWTHRGDVLGDGVGVHAYPAFTGDVDGDGLTDLIFVGQNWSGPGLNIRTKFSNGDGTWTHRGDVLGDGIGVHANPARAGDVDGDGLTDLVFVGQNWSGPGLNIRTKFSNGDGTWTHRGDVLGDGPRIHDSPTLTGDVNGDGRADLIFVGQSWRGTGLNVHTKISNGDGTWTPRRQVLGDGAAVHVHPALTGDVNGDGLTDLIFVGQNWCGDGLNIRLKQSNGDGTWTSRHQILDDGPGVQTYPVLTGTVDHDHQTDLVFIGQDWSGVGLNVRTKLAN